MPRATLATALLASLALTLTTAALGQPESWPEPQSLTYEPIRFTPPVPTREVLANGIVVYLMEDHDLPLVEGVAYVRAPSLYDPEGKAGLAALTASLMREGGAGDLGPNELDAALEFLAASVEADANDFFASVSFSALSDTVDEVLPIWRDVVVRPRFDADRLETERQRQLEAVRRVVDNPVQLAVREFYHRLAEGHPTGNYPTDASLNAITRDDLVAFHGNHFGPANTVLAISGDFDSDTMLRELDATLGAWRADTATPPAIPPLDERPEPKVYYAPKDISQAIILIGQPAVRTYSPEYNDLDVANEILGGGGFSSRIFRDIRTRRGLAYSTGSFLTEGFSYPGDFVAYSISRADVTGEVIALLLEQIRTLQEGGVSQAELDQARSTILNRSLFRFTSPAAINERTARVQLLDLEPGYYERYLENLQTITPDEVQAAARGELDPDRMIVMVVGNADLFDRPLSDFGEVVTIELP